MMAPGLPDIAYVSDGLSEFCNLMYLTNRTHYRITSETITAMTVRTDFLDGLYPHGETPQLSIYLLSSALGW
jgi:hypothetical protein